MDHTHKSTAGMSRLTKAQLAYRAAVFGDAMARRRDGEIRKALARLVEEMDGWTAAERAHVIGNILSLYCQHCGKGMALGVCGCVAVERATALMDGDCDVS